MKDSQKGSVLIIIGLVSAVLVVAAAIYYVFISGMLNKPVENPAGVVPTTQNAPTQVSAPSINNSQDLESASTNLDNTNLNQFDDSLNQNNSDLNSF